MTTKLTHKQRTDECRFAPGPEPVRCTGCGDKIHGSYGYEFKPYCQLCVPRRGSGRHRLRRLASDG